ncbi:MAG: aminotransferase class III-fold pyridoxal phosphate-dependent enzyme, partial [Xanthomonadales bacterium]|nr:aminotransferase class III-fold pyridoxal phosphate-dependent enzyme [Xanthomonadales bacterium]
TSADGRKILDSLSGLWCSSFGHGRKEISDAIARTAREMDFAPSFQFSHPLAFELAQKVAAVTPGDLNHVFFTTSGSGSADTALKMARAYWRAKGQGQKVGLIGRMKAYHGVNGLGTSIGGIGGNRKTFGPLVDVEHLQHTLLKENAFTRGLPEHGLHLADQLEDLIALQDASNVAAVLVEPMSGSGGVVLPPKGYLKRLREICDKHNVLLIFDEVLTGFGRLGAPFGADLFGVQPDMMMLAKGLTNGAASMGAVVASDKIYDTFMNADLPPWSVEFLHGYTYSAHPIACAAGIAAMDIFVNEKMAQRAAEMAPYFEQQVHNLKGLKHISDIRNLGMAAAIQVDNPPGKPGKRPWDISMECWKRGLYLRYSGDNVQLGPPFICDKSEIDKICNILADVIPTVE